MNYSQFLVKSVALSFLVMMSFISCNDSESAKSMESTQKASTEKVKKNELDNNRKSYCFRNENPHTDTKDKDVVELYFEVRGESARGTYNWLPALKDQRRGKFRGMIKDNVIKGEYNFTQEGTSQTARIDITVKENEVVVKGFDPALGLDATIKKVECKN